MPKSKDNVVLHDYHTGRLALKESAPLNVMSSGPVLCTLEGPLLSYIVPTRNKRLYPKVLWERIFSSNYVKEMLDTKTFFCEADHPFAWEERLEIHMPNVACNVRSLWFNDATGEVHGTVDVLDTPNGRILHTFVKYGSLIGISSRGTGSTYIDESTGQVTVDPDSYKFITFDMVPMPGNQVARLSSTTKVPSEEMSTTAPAYESVSMSDALATQLNEAIDNDDIDAVKCMNQFLEYSNLNETFSVLNEKVNSYLESKDEDTSDTITDSSDDIMEAMREIVSLESQLNEYKSNEHSLQDKISELTSLCTEARDTILELVERDKSKSELIESYKSELDTAKSQVTDLTLELESVNNKLADITETYESKLQESTELNESVQSSANNYKHVIKDKTSEINRLVEKLDETNEFIEELNESHSQEVDNLNEFINQLNDSYCQQVDALNEKLTLAERTNSHFSREYALLKSKSLGLSTDLIESVSFEGLTPSAIDKRLRSIYKTNTATIVNESANRLTPTKVVSGEATDNLNESEDLMKMVATVGGLTK